jgi:hypothetical protein
LRSPVVEYFRMAGSVILLSLIFFPLELLAPAEKGQPLTKRLFNLVYVPLFLALAPAARKRESYVKLLSVPLWPGIKPVCFDSANSR